MHTRQVIVRRFVAAKATTVHFFLRCKIVHMKSSNLGEFYQYSPVVDIDETSDEAGADATNRHLDGSQSTPGPGLRRFETRTVPPRIEQLASGAAV
ncbi:hypothetical protein WAI453_000996 [Rhynchosporium graminicola]